MGMVEASKRSGQPSYTVYIYNYFFLSHPVLSSCDPSDTLRFVLGPRASQISINNNGNMYLNVRRDS